MMRPRRVERTHRVREALAFLTDQIRRRHLGVVEVHVTGR